MRTYNILLRNVTSPLTEAGYHVPALLRSCYHPVLDTQLDTVAVNPVGAFHDATFIPERHTSHQDALTRARHLYSAFAAQDSDVIGYAILGPQGSFTSHIDNRNNKNG